MGVASWISLTLAVRNTIDSPHVRDLRSVRGGQSVFRLSQYIHVLEFGKAQIQLGDPRRAECVRAQISEGAIGRSREGRGVDPVIWCRAARGGQ